MKNVLTFALVFLSAYAFGETIHVDSVITMVTDSASVDVAPEVPVWKTIFSFNNVLILFAGLYEIAVRIYPTTKNYSALSVIYNIINLIIPNQKKDGGKHR